MKEVVRRLVPAAITVAAPKPSRSLVIMALTMKPGLDGITSINEKRNIPIARSSEPSAKACTHPNDGKSRLARISGERMNGSE